MSSITIILIWINIQLFNHIIFGTQPDHLFSGPDFISSPHYSNSISKFLQISHSWNLDLRLSTLLKRLRKIISKHNSWEPNYAKSLGKDLFMKQEWTSHIIYTKEFNIPNSNSGERKEKNIKQGSITQILLNSLKNVWTHIKLIGLFNLSIYFSQSLKEYL